MLLEIKPEYRAILAKSPNVVVDIPRSTPAHIRARLVASSIALCEKRSITPFEERCYQADATIFQASRQRSVAAVKKQIAAKPTVVPTIDRRHGELALRYKALSYDQIKRAVRLNYSEDILNAMNLGELGKSLRGSATYGDMNVAGPRSEDGGQVSDAQQTLRDDDDFDWDAEWWDRSLHERARDFHRACASKAKTLESCSAHHECADLHDTAARIYPYGDGASARAASKSLLREKENCL
jgi:hypothetical protein